MRVIMMIESTLLAAVMLTTPLTATAASSRAQPRIVAVHPATGVARIVTVDPATDRPPVKAPHEAARAFLAEHGAAFGIANPDSELLEVAAVSDRLIQHCGQP